MTRACSWCFFFVFFWAHLFLHQYIYFYRQFNAMMCPLFTSLRPPKSVQHDNSCFVSFGLLWAPLFFERSCSSADVTNSWTGELSYLPPQQCMMGGFLGITAVGRNNISEHSRWLYSSAHWLLTAETTHFHTNKHWSENESTPQWQLNITSCSQMKYGFTILWTVPDNKSIGIILSRI